MPFTEGSKFDVQAIIKAYKDGLGLPKIAKKFGISMSNAYNILCKAGVMRSIEEAKIKEWRKLSKVNKSTYTLSLPAKYVRELGLNPEQELIGRWRVENGKLILELKNVNKGTSESIIDFWLRIHVNEKNRSKLNSEDIKSLILYQLGKIELFDKIGIRHIKTQKRRRK